KSLCDDATDGMMKILVQDNKIVGAHIVSNEASSLIQQLVIAMQTNTTVDELKAVCFAHPTYSEGILDCLMRLK
ncbi:dihydrolipoamide dehydrogenase, partial [bacterium]|nr:dihydrolipoamide dehydrogenase [bacterium]